MSNSSAPFLPNDSSIPGARLIGAVAWIVPDDRAGEFEAEWIGELAYAWRTRQELHRDGIGGRLALFFRAVGALPDALWLRRRYGGHPMIRQDLRYALRSLVRQPVFSTVVVLTLGLGIGANAAMFTIVNSVLLRPLPFRAPDQLYFVWGTPTDGDSSKVGSWSSYPDYTDLRDRAKSFAQLAAISSLRNTVVAAGREPMTVQSAPVTANLFPMLGARPALGRAFIAADQRPGAEGTVVLSHALWQSRFGGSQGVVGSSIAIDGFPYTVIGVMPRDFDYPPGTDLWYPVERDGRAVNRGIHSYRVLGRLAPGATATGADAEVRTIAAQLAAQFPESNAKRSARTQPMRDAIVGQSRPMLVMLFGAVGLVLLIACVNVANLLLARTAARSRELAVRTALGAARARLATQFLTESLVLSVLGGALGLGVAVAGSRLLTAMTTLQLPRVGEVHTDLSVVAFLAFVSIATGVVFGVIPALQWTRSQPAESLREGGRSATPGAERRRFRQTLVVSEVALAVVLVVGASLLIKSLWKLQNVDPGLATDHLVVAHVQLPTARYAFGGAKTRAFFHELSDHLSAQPGVRSVSLGYANPLDAGWTSSFRIAGREPPRKGEEPEARVRPVMPDYFRSLGIRMVRGRGIEPRDGAEAPGVVVINEAFAKLHFPNEEPLGRRLERAPWWPGMPPSFEIIGVVASEQFLGPANAPDPATYFSADQFTFNEMWVMVRTQGDPLAITSLLRNAVWAIDKAIPVENVRTMDDIRAETVASPRSMTILLSLFAVVALSLAAVGIYGLLTFAVAQRRNEIGIRMALGATQSRVLRLVVGQGLALTGLGLVTGIVAALGLRRAIDRLLFGVEPSDPLVLVTVALVAGIVAALAAWIPARRASRLDPLVAMTG